MFAELKYAKTEINRFKAKKGVKHHREEKYVYENFWKAQKSRAMQVQSRRETKFEDETFQPSRPWTRWEKRWYEHEQKYMDHCYNEQQWPLGAGW